MREYGSVIPNIGLKTQAYEVDGHDVLGNLIVEKGYWRVPDDIEYAHSDKAYCSDTVLVDMAGNVYRTGNATPVATLAGRPYGFAQLGGDTWILSCHNKIVYCINGTVSTVSNYKIQYCCSLFASRLFWNYGDTLHWSTIGVQELAQILTGAAIPYELALLAQAGQTPFPRITALLPLNDMVLVYGSDQVKALRPIEGGRTYGIFDVAGIPGALGLYGGAVWGSDDQHVFIGTDRNVWQINPNLEAVNLGYSWLFEDAAEEEPEEEEPEHEE